MRLGRGRVVNGALNIAWVVIFSYSLLGPALAVVVAPFSMVGGGPGDRGAVIRELIEQQIRGREDAAHLRLVEGVLVEAVASEEAARLAGERVGADAVCWGNVLGLGDESEIEARITLVRPIE